MKIDKAIEILTKWREECSYDNTEELHEAEKLGIEAMKAVINARANNYYTPIAPLPGETKE